MIINKFRAWDKEKQIMCGVTNISFLVCAEDNSYYKQTEIYDLCTGVGHRKVKLSDINLMQFIGVQDSDGVDIYEGDIVLAYNGRWNYKIFLIKYIGHSFVMAENENDNNEFRPWFYGFYKIGNIYENKELLNYTYKDILEKYKYIMEKD